MRQTLIGLAWAAFTFVLFVALFWTLWIGLPALHRWEKAAGYPYGRMCDANLLNLYQSTCRHALQN